MYFYSDQFPHLQSYTSGVLRYFTSLPVRCPSDASRLMSTESLTMRLRRNPCASTFVMMGLVSAIFPAPKRPVAMVTGKGVPR